MANLVEIIIAGKDQSASAFATAGANMQKAGAEARTMTTNLGASQIAFASAGRAAAAFGAGPLADLASSVAINVAALKTLQAQAVATGATLQASLGAFIAGIAAGAAVMSQVMGSQAEKQAKLDEGYRAAAEIYTRTALEMTKLDDARAGKIAVINAGIDAQIRAVEQLKISEAERVQLYETLDALRAKQLDKAENDERRKGVALLGEFIQKKYEVEYASLAIFTAEDDRHQKALAQIAELSAGEELQRQLREQAVALHEARLTQLTQAESEKRKLIAAQESAARLSNWLAVAAGTSAVLGKLGALAAQQGNKGFKLAQGFAYAEAVVSTAAGVARALKDYAFPYSVIIGGLVAAAGAVQLATIASSRPSGQAHAGMDYVPSEGSYRLSRGEMVSDPGTSRGLREFAADYEGGGASAKLVNVEVYLDSRIILQTIQEATRDGRLALHARAIV